MNEFAKEEYVDGNAISKEDIYYFIQNFYINPVFDNYISNEYKLEVEEAKRLGLKIKESDLVNRARRIIQFFSQVQYKPGLKKALLEEAFAEIEDLRNIQLSLDNDEAERSAKDVTDYEDESEGNADTRSEQLFIKWKVMN